MAAQRVRFIVRGQVQGVGFRPFVFTLAEAGGLTGFVRNSPRGVVIEVQGPPEGLRAFARDLDRRLPPLARVTAREREDIPPVAGERTFVIGPSTAGSAHAVLISPDICTCADCLADMRQGRRLRYPFTNCTNCGPRYTITRSIPYDRARTSMACFPMCPDCLAEYRNPRDRRFHAQPNACPACGPRVWFIKNDGKIAAASDMGGAGGEAGAVSGDAALRATAEHVLGGGIAAIKGLGGFHLACDACDEAAVARLRERKNRPHKPFAVMAASLAEARRFARIGPEEEALLLSPEHPIVLCPLTEAVRETLAPGISPDTACVGVMLPYTPLHIALFEHVLAAAAAGGDARPAVLVMTSGNPGGEPICLGNREALEHLGGMAEAFLFHNRDILIRVDDSVVRPLPGRGTLFFRRARGYVPRPVPLDPSLERKEPHAEAEDAPCVLGAGAELKNTLCLSKGSDAFVSQHIGDMANVETAAFHEEIRDHLAALLRVEPAAVVRDLHPDYLSSRMAEAFANERGLPLYALQHHVAHAHAVLAEHCFRGRALALALDGTGLGEDGSLWGGELLYVDTGGEGAAPAHKRLGHLAPMDLPGGEAAIREPWRIAHALLLRLRRIGQCSGPCSGQDSGAANASPALPWLPAYAQTAALLPAMLERRINTPVSTSCGRLFDAAAALLGLCNAVTYEGQAAIRLEEAQGDREGADEEELYPCGFAPSADSGCLQLDSLALFAALVDDRARGAALPAMARRFHASLAAALAALAAAEGGRLGIRHVGLSGGCLQNRTLALELARRLEGYGLVPLLHKSLPPGDGCISLGQAAWGRHMARHNSDSK